MSSIGSHVLRGAASLAYKGHGQVRLPVLMYHRVMAEPCPLQPAVPHARLAALQFKILKDLFHVRPLEEAMAELQEGRLKPRTVCITFDDGYRDNHDVALPLLAQFGLTATVFVATGFLDGGRMFNDSVLESIRRMPTGALDLSHWGIKPLYLSDAASRAHAIHTIIQHVKYIDFERRQLFSLELEHMTGTRLPDDVMMTSEQVRNLSRKGITIGGHTVSHPILAKIDDTTAEQEIVRNRDQLHDIVGKRPTTFAYPNGKPVSDYSDRHAGMVRAAGYTSAFSTAYGVGNRSTDAFQYPRLVLSKTSYSAMFLQLMRASTRVMAGTQ